MQLLMKLGVTLYWEMKQERYAYEEVQGDDK